MKKYIILIALYTSLSSVLQATIWPLSSGDVSAVYSNATFVSGDTIELNTSGLYSWASKITNLNKSFTLRASAGLASRPVVELPVGVTIATVNNAIVYKLTFDGIDFNGNNVSTGLINVQAAAGGDVIVSVNNCIVRNFASTAVVFVYSSTGTSWASWYGPLKVTNSQFFGPFANILSAGSAYRAPNNTTFDNCYIKKVSGYAIGMTTPGAQSVTINHCTFDSCGTATLKSAEIWIKYGDATVVSVKNSLFANREISTVANLFGNANLTNTNNAVYYTGTASMATLYPSGLGTYINSNPVLNSYNYATSNSHTTAALDGKAIGFSPKLHINVTPTSANLNTNETQQFSATVSDSLSTFIPTVNWSSSLGTINASGLYTATTAGNNIAVTASNYGFSGSALVDVSGINVQITPNAPTIYLGYPIQFSAQAVNQNGEVQTGTASWSTTGNVGNIEASTGNFTPTALGNGTITATIGANSNTINITVVPPSTTINLVMGAHTFSWKFDKPYIQHGTFVDGQPWIVLPQNGVNLIEVSPARIANASVKDRNGADITADIHQTVVNPPVGTYYLNNSGGILSRNAFGWDSRGAIRYGLASSYNAALAWDGTSPLSLQAGDVITTAKSIIAKNPDNTVLDAVATLTVLASAPPTDAFRPGVIKSAARKANPEFVKLSDIVDLSAHLIAQPTTSILNNALSTTVPTAMTAATLTNLFPGPSILTAGLGFNRSFNALYNNSGNGYGADIAQNLGDLAVGSLAAWLTPEERQQCRIRLIQRAIDTYESLLAGVVLSFNGGHLPGYGALITVAGKMLNHSGMLSVNQSVNGQEPFKYLSDYAQAIYIDDSNTNYNDGITPAVGNVRRLSSSSYKAQLSQPILPVVASMNDTLVVSNSYTWPLYRSAREVPNLKLKIESGAGAGSQWYVVTGITNFIDNGTGQISADLAAPSVSGGKLSIKPNWKNGMPNATSVIRASLVTPTEAPCWAFKSGGIASSDGSYLTEFTLSPTTDYGSINIGAYLSLYFAMYALNAENHYSAGLDKWIIRACTLPGYGEHMFVDGNSRNPNGIKDYNGSIFFSGLLKSQILDKVGVTYAGTSMLGELTSLQVPENLTTIDEKSFDKSKFTVTESPTAFRIQSNTTISKLKIFSLAGVEIVSSNVKEKFCNIDKNSFKTGCYIIQVVDENGTYNQKIKL
jgi:hypothetical protein